MIIIRHQIAIWNITKKYNDTKNPLFKTADKAQLIFTNYLNLHYKHCSRTVEQFSFILIRINYIKVTIVGGKYKLLIRFFADSSFY